ncbi:MAG: SpoIIIAH-like family protein [Firmicutes bacterium]|nr:SpoIIIAH-like family protein [Bacillota bacterium]
MEIIERPGPGTRKPKEAKTLETKALCAQEPCDKVVKTKVKTKTPQKLQNAMSKTTSGVKTLFTKRKKYLVLSVMFVLLFVTGYLNFTMNNNSVQTGGGGAQMETNLFNMFRSTRADNRTRDIMIYENLIATSQNASTVASAEARLLEIRANVAFETTAEGLILAQDFQDVIVNKENGFVNVLIRASENITRVQAAQIVSILQSIRADLDIDNMFISIME